MAQGYYLRALKLKNVERELAEEHYVDLKSKPFYPGLVEYIVRRALLRLDCPEFQVCEWFLAALCAFACNLLGRDTLTTRNVQQRFWR